MTNKYSFSELCKTAYSFLLTKLTFGQARLIRRPVFIRGKSSISGAKNLTTGRFCRFDLVGNKKTLFIGSNCEFGDMTHIVAHKKVEFGDNVLIASKCFISDTNHGENASPFIEPNKRNLITHSVKIGDNTWIGENVVILAGTQIGNGCIIGAGAVVKGSIPPNSVAVGSPAQVVKRWNEDSQKWVRVKH